MQLKSFYKPFSILVLSASLIACGNAENKTANYQTAKESKKMQEIVEQIKQENKNNPLVDKPYFQVKILADSCTYNVLLNDIIIDSDEGPMNTTIPVNPYMINGKNTLSIAVQTKKDRNGNPIDQDCQIKATLEVKTSGNFNDDQIYALNSVAFSGNPASDEMNEQNIKGSTKEMKLWYNKAQNDFDNTPKGQVIVENPQIKQGDFFYGYDYDTQKRQNMQGIEVLSVVTIPNTLPHWAWLDGETIESNQQTKDELLAIYQKIWHAIETKDFSSIENLFALRDHEMAEAFYKEKVNTLENIKEDANNPNFHVSIPPNKELLEENTYLNVFGIKNQLSSITFNDGAAILAFARNDKSFSNYYSLIFAKINGQWKIIR